MTQRQRREQFEKFSATELFCPKCRIATPVREKLLLVLPDGNLYQYLCSNCGSDVGTRKETGGGRDFKVLR